MAKILNKCPLCGSKLEYSALMQYANVYTIKNNGELSKKSKKEDVGSMECGYICCSNEKCNFHTNVYLECEEHKDIEIWQKDNRFFYDDSSIRND